MNECCVTVLAHLDGGFSVLSSDIKGLWLETDSLREMRNEILRVGGRLLQANHGLSVEEIRCTTVYMSIQVEKGAIHRRASSPRPKLAYYNRAHAV